MNFGALHQLYKDELDQQILPFWLTHSLDREAGGFFSCLTRTGQVFDTDKFVWLQARQVWLFAKLYEHYQPDEALLNTALHGARFLQQHGRDPVGNWFFALDRSGQPLIQPYNIFSDCFACMAFGQLYRVTAQEAYADIAMQSFERILERRTNPKGIYNKAYPGTRSLRNFALPMILCNLCLELETILDPQLVNDTIETCVREVMEDFYDSESGLILENVDAQGQRCDSFAGRLLNPGHAIEAMWFIMDLGHRQQDKALIDKAVTICLQTLERGWDDTYGGIYYFLDYQGYPPEQLEWDQKLWWVHLETLVALFKGFQHTARPDCLEWLEKVHTYTWAHFPDPEHGEWFGYLNRRGEVLLPLKGGKWKGCFHVPRALWQCQKVLQEIAADQRTPFVRKPTVP